VIIAAQEDRHDDEPEDAGLRPPRPRNQIQAPLGSSASMFGLRNPAGLRRRVWAACTRGSLAM